MQSLLEKTDVWNDVLAYVEKRLNKHIFDSWFRPIKCDGRDEPGKVLYLRAGQVTKDWVTLYYTDLLEQAVKEARAQLESEFAAEVARLEQGYDALTDPLDPVTVKPKAGDIHVHLVGLAWVPCSVAADGRLAPRLA